MAADNQGQPLLQTLEKHIEDMRNLVMCKICIKPLYEPFILSCGHTYCYSCLTSWFTGGDGDRRRKQNMKCPDCRAAVELEPSPNYVLRDLVHMFISRTELLSEDETTQEHETAKADEAVQMISDRNGAGLFKGAFRNGGPRRRYIETLLGAHARGPMHDPHDNVDRCPECSWELEEPGRCNHCEWSMTDDDFEDDSSEDDGSSMGDDIEIMEEEAFQSGRIRRRFDNQFVDPMGSPTGSFMAALDDGQAHFEDYDGIGSPSIVTISSDVDDIDPVDHEFAGNEADPHSDAESDLPAAMGGRRRAYGVNLNQQPRAPPARFYESDVQSTNYDDSDMGDTNLEGTSETGDSDEDGSGNSSEMDDFVEHDTPTRIPHRAPRQDRYNETRDGSAGIYICSDEDDDDDDDDDDEDDEMNTNRETSQVPDSTTAPSVTTAASTSDVNLSNEEFSEEDSTRTPVPPRRPARQPRVILDDSDEDQDQENPNGDSGDESDATTIPAQAAAIRRSRLQNQRVRRGNTNATTRRNLTSPQRRPEALYSRGGFDNGSIRQHPYALQATTSRRGMRQAYAAG